MDEVGVVLVTGATSAIGRAVAERLARGGGDGAGFDLVLAGREVAELERVAADLVVRFGVSALAVGFDAAAEDGAEQLALRVGEAMASRGVETLAGVVAVHGMMPGQADVEERPELMRELVRVNFTSVAEVVLRVCGRVRRGGFVCVVGSVAGDRGRASNFGYGSTKAGLEAFCSGLSGRLLREGVGVVLVKPGVTDTAMTWGVVKSGPLMASAGRVAADVERGIRAGRGVVYSPWVWRWVMLVIRLLPGPIFRRMRF